MAMLFRTLSSASFSCTHSKKTKKPMSKVDAQMLPRTRPLTHLDVTKAIGQTWHSMVGAGQGEHGPSALHSHIHCRQDRIQDLPRKMRRLNFRGSGIVLQYYVKTHLKVGLLEIAGAAGGQHIDGLGLLFSCNKARKIRGEAEVRHLTGSYEDILSI